MMERIPVEVLEMIFDRVPVGQLDKCRLVCKLWQWTIDRLAFDCLVVYLDCPPVNQTLFPTNRKLSLRYCVRMDKLVQELKKKKSIYLKFKKMYFYDHLKFFYFQKRFYCLGDWQKNYLKNVQMLINQLSQLEELHLCDVTDIDRNSKLFLPNLKTFKIIIIVDGIDPLLHSLTLDAPQLKHLSIRYYGNFRLVHPETVETLEIFPCMWRSLFDNHNNFLTSLTGLKRLLLVGKTELEPNLLWKDRMEFLSGLEEIHVLPIDFCKKFYEGMQELKGRANHLRIYISGLEIDALSDLLSTITTDTGYKYLCFLTLWTSDQLDFYQANYAALSKTPQIYGVDYSLIEPFIAGAHHFIPERLPMLQLVIVNQPVRNEHAFGWWLSGLKSLTEIRFLCSLSQEFYSNILPASCPTLPYLTLDFSTPLDFSFLFKLKFLYQLDLATSDYGLVKWLFANLVYLRCLALQEYNPSKQSLGVVKKRKRKRKKMVFQVYNGKEGNNSAKTPFRMFNFVHEFETFESLGEFLDEFTGF